MGLFNRAIALSIGLTRKGLSGRPMTILCVTLRRFWVLGDR